MMSTTGGNQYSLRLLCEQIVLDFYKEVDELNRPKFVLTFQ